MPWVCAVAVALAAELLPNGRAAAQGSAPTDPGGSGRIAGRVVDVETGRPIATARVTIVGRPGVIEADLDGRYRTQPLAAGRYSIRIAFIGYQAVQVDSVAVRDGQTTIQNATLKAAAVELQEVVVNAETRTQASSAAGLLAMQQAAPAVSDGISAEQIAKSPDSDAGDAVARVTGISVVNDRVVVRGLGERYSNTSLNGAELPSPDPQRKVVPLDLFPAGLLDAVVTMKTATPDKPGDFAGGSVDVRTKEFPESRVLQLSLSQEYNSLTTFNRASLPSRTGAALFGFTDRSRDLPELPLPPLGNIQDPRNVAFFQAIRNVWTPAPSRAAPNLGFSLTYGDQTSSGVLGYILSLNYSSKTEALPERLYRYVADQTLQPGTQLGSAGTRFHEASGVVDWGGILNLSVRLSPSHKLSFKNLYTRSGEDQIRTGDAFNVEAAADGLKVYQARYVTRSLRQHQLSGEHLLRPLLGSRLEWRASLAQATEDEPDNRSLQYTRTPSGEDPSTTVFATVASRTSNWFARFLTDEMKSGTLDWSIPFALRATDDALLKVGGLYRTRDRTFDNFYFRLAPSRTAPLDFRQLPPEQQLAPENIATLIDVQRVEDLGASYQVDETVAAGYAMLDFELVPSVRLVGGVRHEWWNFDMTFLQPDGSVPADAAFQQPLFRRNRDLLWSANLTWALTDRMNVRLAGFRSLARPDGREIAPNTFSPIAGECIEKGNRDLHRSSILNGDLRWELYPRPGELLSISGFYKHFDLPIYEEIASANSATCLVQPKNAESAKIYGMELEFRKALDFLPGALAGLSLGANFTYVHSRTVINEAHSGQGNFPALTHQSPYLANANVSFANESAGLSASVLLNYFDDRIRRYGAISFPNGELLVVPSVVERARTTLDAKAQKAFGPHLKVSLAGRNLTGESVRYVQNTKTAGAVVVGAYELGTTVSLGIGYDF